MKLWMRKIFVVLISVLTLGLYVPPTDLHTDAADNKEVSNHDQSLASGSIGEQEDVDEGQESYDAVVDPIEELAERAKAQTVAKMGPRIIQKVDEDMTREILPKIEEVVESIISQGDEDEIPYYEITEELVPGYGEKIFNLVNYKTGEEIARFHVRRDKRPGEGYWFNFHYHMKADEFVKHHTIGEIYWEKNTPPKWMS
ncbi:YpjP family protein [Halobacillus yeomjeoni]|uniref:YpjP family protein n=1 Tax=Halobacillus yeomjeoni TaxID=311194 RepID=UPI001CD3CEB3|nr:YpjP family protein [Halobacillus yeomjeoni]MCA0984586.1 YpjP family protein [Halobacillus yeomjeoni]